MTLYIVRVQKTGEGVGIVQAATVEALFWIIDECTDPTQCEVAILRDDGGILFHGESPPIRDAFREDDEDDPPPQDVRISQRWDVPAKPRVWMVFSHRDRLVKK